MPIVIIGGVTAVGKTSTAKVLKDLYNWDYLEADDFHSKSNIEKMKAGIALTDDDRRPWLLSLHEQVERYVSTKQSCVITCSALKKSYRQLLLTGAIDSGSNKPMSCKDVYIIILRLSRESLERRLHMREDHFMNPALLDSQLKTLELPMNQVDEPYTHVIDCENLSHDDVVRQIQSIINE